MKMHTSALCQETLVSALRPRLPEFHSRKLSSRPSFNATDFRHPPGLHATAADPSPSFADVRTWGHGCTLADGVSAWPAGECT